MDRPPDDSYTETLVFLSRAWYIEFTDKVLSKLGAFLYSENHALRFACNEECVGITSLQLGEESLEGEFVCLELDDVEFEAALKRLGRSGTDKLPICLPFHDDMLKKVLDGMDFSRLVSLIMSEGMDDQAVDRPNLDVLIQTWTSNISIDNMSRSEFCGRVFSTRSRIMSAALELFKRHGLGTDLKIAGSFTYSDKDVIQSLASVVATSSRSLTGFDLYSCVGRGESRHKEVAAEALDLLLPALKVGPCDSISQLYFDGCLWNESITRLLDDLLKGKPSIQEICLGNESGNETTFISLAKVLCSNNIKSLLIQGRPRLFVSVVNWLVPDTVDHRPNTYLQILESPGIEQCHDDGEEVELAAALRKCVEADFLAELRIPHDMTEECVTNMLQSLKLNRNLEVFRINEAWRFSINRKDHDVDKLYALVMDVLRLNYGLKTVYICWFKDYYRESVNGILAERAQNNVDWEVMKDMDLVPPTAARVFLCGYPYAGKTTLTETIMKILNDAYDRKTRFNERTRGIEVQPTIFNNFQLTWWDMAGHDEYHPFHNLMISSMSGSGSSSCFLLVCNPLDHETNKPKDYDEIDREVSYWLQFIVSNIRKSLLYFPRVIVVFTHRDLFIQNRLFVRAVQRNLKKIHESFKDVSIEFNDDPIIINAQDSGDVSNVLKELEGRLKSLLNNLPLQMKACQEVLDVLKKYKRENPHSPLLKWKDFLELSNEIPSLSTSGSDQNLEVVEKRKSIVAASLHEAGDVIFYKDLSFMVVDPHWFCHGIIGQVISCKEEKSLDRDRHVGTISTLGLKDVLEISLEDEEVKGVEIEDLIQLMMKLNLCFKVDDEKILIPVALQDEGNKASDGLRKLEWPSPKDVRKNWNYVGRRVGPVDSDHTQLTLGFFPHLQVSFQKKYGKLAYQLEKHMIKFIWNGLEIILEYSGQVGYYIDILIRSSKDPSDIHNFVQNEIVKHIYRECAHPLQGCAGVVLQESMLRPSCIECLDLCKHRSKQAVLVKDLKEKVINDVKESNSLNFHVSSSKLFKTCFHTWPISDALKPDSTMVEVLFNEKEKEDICKSLGIEYHEKSHIDASVKLPCGVIEEPMSSQLHSDSFVLVNLKEVIQSLLKPIMDKLEEILKFSVALEKYDGPKVVKFVRKEEKKEKKMKNIIPRVYRKIGVNTDFTLHLLCESLDDYAHDVEGQEGCPLKLSIGDKKQRMIAMFWILKVVTMTTKIAAHVTGGMGDMVPDLAEGFAHALDTAGLLDDVLSKSLSKLEANSDFEKSGKLVMDNEVIDNEVAVTWLKSILEKKQMTPNDFGLFRVRYMNCGPKYSGHIAWVCQKCKEKGEKEKKLDILSS